MPGQIVIYPQGTRVAPGAVEPYKVGSAVLYGQLKQDCVPVGTNAGVLWPKRGIMRQRGTAVVEFLPAIAPGLSNAEFMARLESDIEASSNALMAEAGFQ
jgi:1-acyl-sn-glycerol-3-phosphate acyltransferase